MAKAERVPTVCVWGKPLRAQAPAAHPLGPRQPNPEELAKRAASGRAGKIITEAREGGGEAGGGLMKLLTR